LPALILQRANPGLYDMFQNALLQAKETMQIATKSCEQMEAEIAKGKNPYADLITLSKGNDWKLQMGIGGNDAVTAKKAVEAANGDNGVPWIGGQAGGAGQPVLEFTGDLVKAGYNINMNRPITATGPVPLASATRLTEIWPTPTDARNWVVDVVGENIVTTCDTCRKDSIPGTGLLPKLNLQASLSLSRNKQEGMVANRTKDANIGLSLQVPIYNGGYNHAAVREARHKVEAAGMQVAVARRAVEKAVVQAWYNLQAAKRLIAAATAQVKAAKLAYRGVREEYKAGSRTTLDVLNARQALNNARVELVKARAAKVSSAYALLAAMGELTAQRLGLRVARYDAKPHYKRVKNKWYGTRD